MGKPALCIGSNEGVDDMREHGVQCVARTGLDATQAGFELGTAELNNPENTAAGKSIPRRRLRSRRGSRQLYARLGHPSPRHFSANFT